MAHPGEIWAQKFNEFLRSYPRSDGRQWRGVDFERATNEFINGSYVTALKKGRIEEPGLNKLRRISEVMGFDFYLWFEDVERLSNVPAERQQELARDSLASRVNYLFDTFHNEETGRPYTDREVATRSHGRLSESDVRRLRSGELTDPTRVQLLALCDVFDVDFSYWDEPRNRPPLMNPETLKALKDADSLAILHKSYDLPQEDKSLIMMMMEELERRRSQGGEDSR